jgi:flagellar biosynthetic protein FliO
MSDSGFQAVSNGAAAILVLGLLVLTVWVLRKKGLTNFSAGGLMNQRQMRLSVVERLALGPQHSLYLVQVTDQVLLLGSSPAGISLIETAEGAKRSSGLPGVEG